MAKSKRSDGVTIWWVYFVRCRTGRIYTGISPDPQARLKAHRRQTSANMRMNAPIELIGAMPVGGYKDAIQLERRIKRLPASMKEEISARSEWMGYLGEQKHPAGGRGGPMPRQDATPGKAKDK